MLENVGFQIVKTGGDGTVAVDPRSPRPRIREPVASLLQRSLFTAVARRLGAGMIMYAFARKPCR